MKRMAGLVFKILFVLLLFIVFFSYAMFQGGFVSWFLFYSFLPIIFYLLFFLFYPISNWRVTRNVTNASLEASGKAEITIHLNRKLAFPIYYCIIEEVLPDSLHYQDTNRDKYLHMENEDLLAQRRVVRNSVFPWFQKNIVTSYQLELLPRGHHHLKKIRVRCGDFFGFVKKEHVFNVNSRLLVYPAKREVSIKAKSSSLDGGSSVSYNMQTKSSNVVTGVREYAPGDRFSWIDWKSTARRNSVMTKEFEQEKSMSMSVVLNAAAYPGMNRIAYEGSVELAASLIQSLQKTNTPFSFLSLGKEKKLFPYQTSPVNRKKITQFLAEVNPEEKEDFAHLLRSELVKLPGGTTVMIITTRLDEETKLVLERIKRKSRHAVLFLVKPEQAISQKEKAFIRELGEDGIIVNLITEEKLVQQRFEVNA